MVNFLTDEAQSIYNYQPTYDFLGYNVPVGAAPVQAASQGNLMSGVSQLTQGPIGTAASLADKGYQAYQTYKGIGSALAAGETGTAAGGIVGTTPAGTPIYSSGQTFFAGTPATAAKPAAAAAAPAPAAPGGFGGALGGLSGASIASVAVPAAVVAAGYFSGPRSTNKARYSSFGAQFDPATGAYNYTPGSAQVNSRSSLTPDLQQSLDDFLFTGAKQLSGPNNPTDPDEIRRLYDEKQGQGFFIEQQGYQNARQQFGQLTGTQDFQLGVDGYNDAATKLVFPQVVGSTQFNDVNFTTDSGVRGRELGDLWGSLDPSFKATSGFNQFGGPTTGTNNADLTTNPASLEFMEVTHPETGQRLNVTYASHTSFDQEGWDGSDAGRYSRYGANAVLQDFYANPQNYQGITRVAPSGQAVEGGSTNEIITVLESAQPQQQAPAQVQQTQQPVPQASQTQTGGMRLGQAVAGPSFKEFLRKYNETYET